MDRSQQLFELRVLGAPSLKDASGATPEALGWGKPLALLALLSVRTELRRDEVVDLLWRDVEEGKARNAFRQALHRLRSAVGDDLLPQDRERLRLLKSDALAIDLDRFEAAITAGQFERAVELYASDFLQDAVLGEPAFDLWVEQERTRIRAKFRNVLERAMAQASSRGDSSRAVTYARRLVLVAPFEAEAAHLAAATMVSAGQAREAFELLVRFAARCESELGVSVPPEIRSLMTRLERSRETADKGAGTIASQPLTFAGRESELARLLTLWRTVEQDAGALALIEGEPGIGKSRLVQELVSHARALRPATIVVARERPSPTPLGIFAEALRPLVRAPGIAGASPHLLAEAARLLPELRDTIELPPVSDVEDEASRLRFFEGVAALIDATAYERALLIVLEDLEHVAPSSLDLLTYLASRLAGSPVMFVLTMRADAPVSPRLRALAEPSPSSRPAHGDRAVRLSLGTLPLPALQVAAAGTSAGNLGSDIIERICHASDGVPGKLADLLRRAAGGEDVTRAATIGPERTAQLVQGLSSAHRRVLVVLALLRRPANALLIASAAHLPAPATRDALTLLEADGLVERTDEDAFLVHEDIAEIAAAAAGSDARAFLSGWIAAALQEHGASPSELARFHAAAGDTERAFDGYRRAAFDALALGAAAEAVAFFTAARGFATTPDRISDIEGLLSALGSGRMRIAPTPEDATAVALAAQTRPAVDGTSRWVRLVPHWRLLLGGAVATLVVSAFVLWRTPVPVTARGTPADTLVVGEGDPARALRRVTFDDRMNAALSAPLPIDREGPTWLDSLPRGWGYAIVSPRGTHVALTHTTTRGRELFVIGTDRRDTIALAIGSNDAAPLDWSPDGAWLLAGVSRELAGGRVLSELVGVNVADTSRHTTFDSSTARMLVEARWAPDGTHLAWVARVGDDRQLEVFVSRADGTGRSNVSRDPADDYHLSWSGDGEILAFTSTRDGNAELYAYTLADAKTWRLTRNPAQDDWARYSADGRWLAFESTRSGSEGVYVMPGLGGEASLVRSRNPLLVRRWQSGPTRYLDELRVVPTSLTPDGDSVRLRVVQRDQLGDSLPPSRIRFQLLDSASARLIASADSISGWTLVAARGGVVRVVASAGGWRTDTAAVRLGTEAVALLQGGARISDEWLPLGDPRPRRTATGQFLLESDRDWESGVLSREAVPLLPGLTFATSLNASVPLSEPEAAWSLALVAPEAPAALDYAQPQFLKYASVSWNSDARRLVYAVGREVYTEVVGAPDAGTRRVTIQVERDSTVSFSVDGKQRWRSALRVITDRSPSRVQVWIGARGTGGSLTVRDVQLLLSAISSR